MKFEGFGEDIGKIEVSVTVGIGSSVAVGGIGVAVGGRGVFVSVGIWVSVKVAVEVNVALGGMLVQVGVADGIN